MDEKSEKIAENASAAAIFSFVIFFTSSGLFYHFQNLTPMIFHWGGFLLIASFLSFFILEGFFAIFVRSIFISVLFSFQYYVPYPLNWFIISVTLFHLGKDVFHKIIQHLYHKISSFISKFRRIYCYSYFEPRESEKKFLSFKPLARVSHRDERRLSRILR